MLFPEKYGRSVLVCGRELSPWLGGVGGCTFGELLGCVVLCILVPILADVGDFVFFVSHLYCTSPSIYSPSNPSQPSPSTHRSRDIFCKELNLSPPSLIVDYLLAMPCVKE